MLNQTIKLADKYIDKVWGVRVRLIPYSQSSEYVKGQVDTTRPEVTTTAVPFIKKAETTKGLKSSVIAESQVSISIRDEPVEAAGLKKDDRVEYKNNIYSVVLISKRVSGRTIVDLVRVNE